MTSPAPPLLPLADVSGPATAAPPADVRSASLTRRLWLLPLQFFWGMAFCQSLAGSVLVVGWAYRLAQRAAIKRWWMRSARGRNRSERFETFAQELVSAGGPAVPWPTWFAFPQMALGDSQPGSSVWEKTKRRFKRALGGLAWNWRTGLTGLVNTSVLALPPGLLWWFGWYDGWNNSFTKGYEHAAVGPLISVVGILIFIAVMFYLPLAQARQSVTGSMRDFYDFRMIWVLIRRQWLGCLGLALAYAALAFPANVLKTLPMFLPQINPNLETLSAEQALQFLQRYFFWGGAWVFPAYVALRVMAARLYAAGLLAAVQDAVINPTALAPAERLVLDRLELLTARPMATRHIMVRLIRWTGTVTGRWVAGSLAFLVWFSFVAQIYIAEFFSYHQAQGFVNQPLIQLPWFSYLPTALAHPAREIPLLLGITVLWAVTRRTKKR